MGDLHPAGGGLLVREREAPIEVSVPLKESANAEMVPVSAPGTRQSREMRL
jgi:hypothetical protein